MTIIHWTYRDVSVHFHRKEREALVQQPGHQRLNKLLVQVEAGDADEDQSDMRELRHPVRELCKTVDAFIYVVNSSSEMPTGLSQTFIMIACIGIVTAVILALLLLSLLYWMENLIIFLLKLWCTDCKQRGVLLSYMISIAENIASLIHVTILFIQNMLYFILYLFSGQKGQRTQHSDEWKLDQSQ